MFRPIFGHPQGHSLCLKHCGRNVSYVPSYIDVHVYAVAESQLIGYRLVKCTLQYVVNFFIT